MKCAVRSAQNRREANGKNSKIKPVSTGDIFYPVLKKNCRFFIES
jgi:hypothetical protein